MRDKTLKGSIADELYTLARQMTKTAGSIERIDTLSARIKASVLRDDAKMARQWARSLKAEHRAIIKRGGA